MGAVRKKPGDIRLLLVIIFSLLAMGIAAAGVMFYMQREENLAERAMHQLAAIAELKAREIALWRNQQLANARTLERNPFAARAVRDYLVSPEDTALGREVEVWLRGLQEDFGYKNVILLDRNGAVRASVFDTIPLYPHVLEQTLDAVPTAMPLFFNFHRVDSDGAVVLSLYIRIFDPDRPTTEPMGFLVIKIDPEEFLYPFIQRWPTPSETAETLLVERQKEGVVFLNELRHLKGTALTLHRPLTEATLPATHAAKGLTGTMEGIDYRGEPVYSAFLPVPGSPWALVAKVDRQEVRADLLEDAVLLASLVAALLVASGVVMLYIEKRRDTRFYKERQAALEEKEKLLLQLEAVLNNIIEGVAISDLDGNILIMNLAALNMHDFESVDPAQQHLHRFQEDFELAELDGRVIPVEEWPMSHALRGEKFVDREVRILHRRTGKTWIASFNGTPVMDKSGKAILAVVTLRDVTDRKQAEEEIRRLNTELEKRAFELESANRDLAAFNYTIAHDLRKPLTVIGGYIQVLEELCAGKLDAQCTDYLQKTYDSTLRMNRLIDALLNFSNLARTEPKKKAVDISDLAHAVAAELKLAEPERRVSFLIGEELIVEGDENLLRMVLDNLFGNAWKYTSMREEAIIEFGMTDNHKEATFFVRDNGIGFDMAEKEKLFLPFERLPGTEDFSGFGIGLATVERIIRRHGGRVWAEGAPGMGAIFYFTLG